MPKSMAWVGIGNGTLAFSERQYLVPAIQFYYEAHETGRGINVYEPVIRAYR
jgi:hypothetical protein